MLGFVDDQSQHAQVFVAMVASLLIVTILGLAKGTFHIIGSSLLRIGLFISLKAGRNSRSRSNQTFLYRSERGFATLK
jgi:hypothetical protein